MSNIRWYGPSLVLVLAVLFVMVAGPGVAQRIEHARRAQHVINVREELGNSEFLDALSQSFRKVAQAVEPSVVSIEVAAKRDARVSRERLPLNEDWMRRFFGPEEEAPQDQPRDGGEDFDRYNAPQTFGNGSGWVYDNAGHIVTNRHVVADADRITVTFSDKSKRDAKLVAADAKTDIAVLKVEGGNVVAAQRAAEPVQQGDIVFAFGSPFRFEFSMSQGIVSGKGRQLGILGTSGYEYFIQTDAAINPGNSGGPLTNVRGEVVGMNTAIATRTGAYNGLGFAIPVDMVEQIVNQLLERGKVTRGYLGVFIRDVDPKLGKTFGFEGSGVLIEQPIEGGPAEKAGLQRGDIVTHVDGQEVATADQLRRRVAMIPPGQKVALHVFRQGKSEVLEVEVFEQPEQMAEADFDRGGISPTPREPQGVNMELLRKLGIEGASTLDERTAKRMGLKVQAGVLVERVRAGSVAASVGIRPRAVVTDVQGTPVQDVADLVDQLGKHDLKQGVRVTVFDGDTPRFVLLELPE